MVNIIGNPDEEPHFDYSKEEKAEIAILLAEAVKIYMETKDRSEDPNYKKIIFGLLDKNNIKGEIGSDGFNKRIAYLAALEKNFKAAKETAYQARKDQRKLANEISKEQHSDSGLTPAQARRDSDLPRSELPTDLQSPEEDDD